MITSSCEAGRARTLSLVWEAEEGEVQEGQMIHSSLGFTASEATMLYKVLGSADPSQTLCGGCSRIWIAAEPLPQPTPHTGQPSGALLTGLAMATGNNQCSRVETNKESTSWKLSQRLGCVFLRLGALCSEGSKLLPA